MTEDLPEKPTKPQTQDPSLPWQADYLDFLGSNLQAFACERPEMQRKKPAKICKNHGFIYFD